ncbi:hypothetical protein SCE1572_24115 [Sorangium cellulosum So0157-2]|uniref:Uncharacterized protein n=1 Tax=Sorangium cellulosum So0157-2 TaxID=1254432 RepID=S4XY61_SORCE|nr:hypothetical protein SCE1572_24115 [Sorangium cellulosum So0157-2]
MSVMQRRSRGDRTTPMGSSASETCLSSRAATGQLTQEEANTSLGFGMPAH